MGVQDQDRDLLASDYTSVANSISKGVMRNCTPCSLLKRGSHPAAGQGTAAAPAHHGVKGMEFQNACFRAFHPNMPKPKKCALMMYRIISLKILGAEISRH